MVVVATVVAFGFFGSVSAPPAAHTVFLEAERGSISASRAERASTEIAATSPTLLANVAAQETAPACDPSACGQAYVSFRATDCTYQPYEGPRQLCTR